MILLLVFSMSTLCHVLFKNEFGILFDRANELYVYEHFYSFLFIFRFLVLLLPPFYSNMYLCSYAKWNECKNCLLNSTYKLEVHENCIVWYTLYNLPLTFSIRCHCRRRHRHHFHHHHRNLLLHEFH